MQLQAKVIVGKNLTFIVIHYYILEPTNAQ
jgi:hypothetical protein